MKSLFLVYCVVIAFACGHEPIKLAAVSFTVPDDTPRGTLIGRVTIPEITNKEIKYEIDRSDLDISPTGEITLQADLKSNLETGFTALVTAFIDEKKYRQKIFIEVRESNNARPTAYTVPSPCAVVEESSPSEVCTIFVNDADELRRRDGPYSIEIRPEFEYAHLVELRTDKKMDMDRGGARVVTKGPIDRELIKSITILLLISSENGMEFNDSVRVEIKDIDDNPSYDGESEIVLYAFNGITSRGRIGRFYTQDLDVADQKSFKVKSSRMFQTDSSGNIFVGAGTPLGKHVIESTVYEPKRNVTVRASVTINVQALDKSVLDEHVVLALSNTSLKAEELLISPALQKFRQEACLWIVQMNRSPNSICDIKEFAIDLEERPVKSCPQNTLNIRIFGTLNGTVIPGVVLRGILSAKSAQLRDIFGGVVGIDESACQRQRCNGCRLLRNATNVITTVETSKNSMASFSIAEEVVCGRADEKSQLNCSAGLCGAGICYNSPTGPFCQCPLSTAGHNCERQSQKYNGNIADWYPSLPASENLTITFEFRSPNKNAVLLYNGPLDVEGADQNDDFLLITLENGRMIVRIKVNSTVTTLLSGNDSSLNDNAVHAFSFVRLGGLYILEVDKEATSVNSTAQPYFSRFPMQVGGVYKSNVPLKLLTKRKGFIGCLIRLRINGRLVDLGHSLAAGSRVDDCDCEKNACKHGECVGVEAGTRCLCPIGWVGSRCEKPATWFEHLDGTSFTTITAKDQSREEFEYAVLAAQPGRNGSSYALRSDDIPAISVRQENGKLTPTFGNIKVGKGVEMIKGRALFVHAAYRHSWSEVIINDHRDIGVCANDRNAPQMRENTLGSIKFAKKTVQGAAGCYLVRMVNGIYPDLQDVDNSTMEMHSEGVRPGCSILLTCQQAGSQYCALNEHCVNTLYGAICVCNVPEMTKLADDGTLLCLAPDETAFRFPVTSKFVSVLVLCLCLLAAIGVYARRELNRQQAEREGYMTPEPDFDFDREDQCLSKEATLCPPTDATFDMRVLRVPRTPPTSPGPRLLSDKNVPECSKRATQED